LLRAWQEERTGEGGEIEVVGRSSGGTPRCG
jgi:hypothetical protein